MDDLPAARVAHADDPRRLRHASWAVSIAGHLAVVDLTVGDLKVGPVLLLGAADVQLRHTPTGPRLDRAAAAADLFVRPLFRGRVVQGQRLAEARAAWRRTPPAERAALLTPQAVGSCYGRDRGGPPARRREPGDAGCRAHGVAPRPSPAAHRHARPPLVARHLGAAPHHRSRRAQRRAARPAHPRCGRGPGGHRRLRQVQRLLRPGRRAGPSWGCRPGRSTSAWPAATSPGSPWRGGCSASGRRPACRSRLPTQPCRPCRSRPAYLTRRAAHRPRRR